MPRTPVSRQHSFVLTLKNNRTEKEGLEFARSAERRFVLPDKSGRASLLTAFDIPKRLSRAFDLVMLPKGHDSSVDQVDVKDVSRLVLVEVKTTKAHLPRFPRGFFFGATQNEFELASRLGGQFRFCFVCLNPSSPGMAILTLSELEAKIRTKRVQYQINL